MSADDVNLDRVYSAADAILNILDSRDRGGVCGTVDMDESGFVLVLGDKRGELNVQGTMFTCDEVGSAVAFLMRCGFLECKADRPG